MRFYETSCGQEVWGFGDDPTPLPFKGREFSAEGVYINLSDEDTWLATLYFGLVECIALRLAFILPTVSIVVPVFGLTT